MKAIKKLSPLMQQYQIIKDKYNDAVVLFRVHDFYESFGTCAKTLSNVTGVNLVETENKFLAGFELKYFDEYITKLVRAGHRVAICQDITELSKTINRNIKKSLP